MVFQCEANILIHYLEKSQLSKSLGFQTRNSPTASSLSLPTTKYVYSLDFGARGENRTLGAKTSLEKNFQSFESTWRALTINCLIRAREKTFIIQNIT